jgi:hypothetical protein
MGKKQLACSFCGKDSAQVAKLIAGPGVFICDACVGLCNEILVAELGDYPGAERVSQHGPVMDRRLPDWQTMSLEDLLAGLPRMAATQVQAEDSLKDCVARLRELGVTWQRIGDTLGMTRQSAWGRFAGEE